MVNVFKAYLAQELVAGGSETVLYLDRITTLTGETITTSQFSTLGRGIISVNPDGNGETSYPEYISFEAVSGETLTGATRGLSALGNSVVTANKRYHPVGTPVVISIGAHNIQDLIDYIDDNLAATVVGTSNVMIGTAGETLVAGDFVYLKNDSKWWKTDADTEATVFGVQLGIAQGAGAADGAITNGVMTRGLDTNQSGLVAGTTYYLSNTAGEISDSAGTYSRIIGVAKSTTTLYFDPIYAYPSNSLPTAFVSTSAGAADEGKGVKLNASGELDKTFIPFTTPTVNVYEVGDSPATWTKPAGLKYVIVEVQAGGGGGGGSTVSNRRGGGGGGGGYSKKCILDSSLGATETVTTGAGGTGSASTTGGTGGTSSFGSHCSATGGAGGECDSSTSAGGAGGTGSGGDVNLSGQSGDGGAVFSATDDIYKVGSGGDSYFGYGGNEAQFMGGTSSTNGNAGGLYGGGASGSGNQNGPDTTGKNGGAGIVIVTEYYN